MFVLKQHPYSLVLIDVCFDWSLLVLVLVLIQIHLFHDPRCVLVHLRAALLCSEHTAAQLRRVAGKGRLRQLMQLARSHRQQQIALLLPLLLRFPSEQIREPDRLRLHRRVDLSEQTQSSLFDIVLAVLRIAHPFASLHKVIHRAMHVRVRIAGEEKRAAEMRAGRAVRSSLLANVLVEVRRRQNAA